MLEKLLASSRKKNILIIVFMLLVLVISIISSYLNYVQNKAALYTSIDKMLKNTALHYNTLFEKDFHDRALEKNSISLEEDLKNIAKTSSYINAIESVYSYTTIVKDNKLYFTSSSSTEEEIRTKDRTHYFDYYESADEALFSIIQQDKPVFLTINDQWGVFRSINIPLQTKKGNRYILSADIEIGFIQKILNTHIKQIIILQIIFILFLIFISIYLIRISKKEIGDIDRLRQNLEHANQELEKKVDEKTKKLNNSLRIFGENVISLNTDLQGNIIYASPALCSISEYTEKELLGESHNILNYVNISGTKLQDILDTIKLKNIWTGEVQKKTKLGKYYWMRTSVIPILDEEDKTIGYSSIGHDIKAQKAKEEFMANMSHELRTPLNAIIGFSTILNKRLKLSKNQELSQQITTSSQSLLSLINDILDLSKIQDSRFTISPYEFDAYSEIQSCLKQLEGLTSQKSINFTSTISENLQAIFIGDWARINQIILNLISNAIKFTPEDGKILSSFAYINDVLLITIADTGIGMKKEIQDRIFQPFEQADGSTTRKYGGTGLGLSITQTLIEIMEGSITLHSEENVGTSFQVNIPLERLRDSEEVTQVEEIQNKEKTLQAHVLVAEDNKTNKILISMLLDDFGISCDIANDGLEAIKMYNPDTHQLILMDENMPNMNGLEAMKILHEKYQDRCGSIIALTANAMAGDKNRFLDAGMDGYIPKPIDENVLYNTLVEFLGKRKV